MPPADQHNLLLSLIVSLLVAPVAAYYADTKGRSPFIWFVLGLLFSFLSLIALYFLPNLDSKNKNTGVDQPTMSVYTPGHVAVNELPKQKSLEENKLWYYLDKEHQQFGPVSIYALKELWDTGRLELNSYVWSEGMSEWEIVDHLPDLKAALKRVQV